MIIHCLVNAFFIIALNPLPEKSLRSVCLSAAVFFRSSFISFNVPTMLSSFAYNEISFPALSGKRDFNCSFNSLSCSSVITLPSEFSAIFSVGFCGTKTFSAVSSVCTISRIPFIGSFASPPAASFKTTPVFSFTVPFEAASAVSSAGSFTATPEISFEATSMFPFVASFTAIPEISFEASPKTLPGAVSIFSFNPSVTIFIICLPCDASLYMDRSPSDIISGSSLMKSSIAAVIACLSLI